MNLLIATCLFVTLRTEYCNVLYMKLLLKMVLKHQLVVPNTEISLNVTKQLSSELSFQIQTDREVHIEGSVPVGNLSPGHLGW